MVNKTDRVPYFCHSCGGVTVYLTPQEAAEERAHGHDVELLPSTGQAKSLAVQQ